MDRKNPFQPLDPRPLPPSGSGPLEVCLVRGDAIESRHRVHAVVCDNMGNVREHWGNPQLSLFPRSSIKLIQAVSWVAPEYSQWKLGQEEMSIACGSHEGEEGHVQVVSRWLERLGLTEANLECGVHEPYHRPSARALARRGEEPCQIHNNCSGKHCGFLTACLAEGWPLAGYTNYDHPIQARLRTLMEPFFDVDFNKASWGIDGCGIPTYAVPLRALATAMARVADARVLDSQIQKAVSAITHSIAAHPELIGGSESFSSKVVPQTEGRVFAKVGAEGVYGVWIPTDGLGIAVKTEDGNARGAEVALAAILRELGHPLSFFSPFSRRWTGEIVGQFICG